MNKDFKGFFKKISSSVLNNFSNNIAIDLGTANTLVYLKDSGLVINEPSIIAINEKTNRIVAFGKEAKEMHGRTPKHIKTVRPIVDGVVSNFEVATEMISFLISKTEREFSTKTAFLGPRVIVGIPSNVTNVDRKAVLDAIYESGAREVFLVEEPMAAAIGNNIDINEPKGVAMVDIGGGTTDVAIISLGSIVLSKSVKIAGDLLNENIVDYIKEKQRVLIGEKTAEICKIEVGTLETISKEKSIKISGRDITTGLPKEITVTSSMVKKAIEKSIESLFFSIKEILEKTPPELSSDIHESGIYFSGGGSLIPGLKKIIKKELKVVANSVNDPLTSVVRGLSIIIEDRERFRAAIIEDEDDSYNEEQ